MQDYQANRNGTPETQRSIQQQIVNLEGQPPEPHAGEDSWLLMQFNSAPFLLYKFWLLLHFIGALIFEIFAISNFVDVFVLYPSRQFGDIEFDAMSWIMSLTLLLYACGEMLFAINRKKSSAAQRSFLKFQYYLIGSIMFITSIIEGVEEIWGWLLVLYLIISSIVHLVGGHVVLKTFQKNHPLRRNIHPKVSQTSDPLMTDFLEQNEAILSEISKYEEQLNSWPYRVYNWWLKFAVFFEILVIFSFLLLLTTYLIVRQKFLLNFLLGICALVFSLFNAYSRFEMEVAIRTRTFARSKRAVALLQISIVASILTYMFIATNPNPDALNQTLILVPSLGWSLGLFFLIPVICLIGAIKSNKILEQRETFVKVSSYTEDSYI